jgi:hypothetical protein
MSGNKYTRVKFLSLAEKIAAYTPRKPLRGCWIWTGPQHHGYAEVSHNKKQETAQRATWRVINGSIPKNRIIGRKCLNKLCVRPDHLYLGRRLDAARRRRDAGRDADKRGELNGRAKLTAARVLRMRRLATNKRGSIAAIAKRFGLPHSSARQAINGNTWRHLPRAVRRGAK